MNQKQLPLTVTKNLIVQILLQVTHKGFGVEGLKKWLLKLVTTPQENTLQ